MPNAVINSERTGWLWALAISLFALFVPFLINSEYYFWDDKQHQFLPMMMDIGRALKEFEMPYLSLRHWWGGNYLVEYQPALFNPVSLLTYVAIADFEDLHLASLVLAAPYMLILGLGSYFLLRELGSSALVALFGVAIITTNNFMSYWYASSWHPIFVSFAWLPITWFFLLKSQYSKSYSVAAVVGIYLLLSAGWPQGNIVVGFLCASLIVSALLHSSDKRYAFRLLLIGASGLMLALPSALPIISALDQSARESSFFNNSFLAPPLSDVLNLITPSYKPFLSVFSGYDRLVVPPYYLNWLLPILLFFVDWKAIEWKRTGLWVAAVGTVFCLLLTMGPEQIGPLRWPIRFLPNLHLFLVVAMLMIALNQKALNISKTRIQYALMSFVFIAFISFSNSAKSQDFWLAVVMLLLVSLFLLIYRRKVEQALGFAIAVTLSVFVVTHIAVPVNTQVGNWKYPRYLSEHEKVPNSEGNVLHLTTGSPQIPLGELKSGNLFLFEGMKTINGYSPVGHKKLNELMCFHPFSFVCFDVLDRIFEVDPLTQRPWADLMAVDEIVVADNLGIVELSEGWERVAEKGYTSVYERVEKQKRCGSVVYASNGVNFDRCNFRSDYGAYEELEFQVLPEFENSSSAKVIFSRLYWPGYRVLLDGKQLPVSAHRGIFLSVDIPPGIRAGRLEIDYFYPMPTIALWSVIAGFMLFLVLLLGSRNSSLS